MPHCEICGKDDFRLISAELREGPGRICRCKSCGLVIQDAAWTSEDIERYYNEEYQKAHSLDVNKEQSPQEHFDSRLKTIKPLIERVHKALKKNMSVLEVGCGAGELLYSIKGKVKDVAGLELSKGFVDFMKNKLNIEAYAEDVNKMDFGARKFDFIISVATLDHLPNPLETLITMKRLLSRKGLVYIELPNLDQALNFYLPENSRKAFNRFFWHKGHFFYFDRKTLSKLMQKAGFDCDITCRHEYTLRNYLNWYFTGSSQATFVDATTGVGLFSGGSPFEKGMNEIFMDIEGSFHKLMARTFKGDTLCCLAKPTKG